MSDFGVPEGVKLTLKSIQGETECLLYQWDSSTPVSTMHYHPDRKLKGSLEPE